MENEMSVALSEWNPYHMSFILHIIKLLVPRSFEQYEAHVEVVARRLVFVLVLVELK